MKILRVENLDQAVRYARQCRDEGEFDLFRGQVQPWPLMPTLLRLPAPKLEEAASRMTTLLSWIEGTPDVAEMLPTLQSRIAVAQHYGLPTPLMDVSRDPRIAGFFASHTSQPPPDGAESCIYCFHSDRIREIVEGLRKAAIDEGFPEDEIELPSLIEIDVSNLWRLQAQHGAFILAPDWIAEDPAERLIERMLEVTCLVFPYTGPLDGLEERWVYPDRKSALEVRLDEFFVQEAAGRHNAEMRAGGVTVIDSDAAQDFARDIDFAALGFRQEAVDLIDLQRRGDNASVFRGGVVPEPHESWTDEERVAPWLAMADERFHETFTDEVQWITVEAAEDLEALERSCVRQVSALLESGALSRSRAVRWRVVDASGAEIPAPTDDGGFPDPDRRTGGRWVDLAWDGMRALPYEEEELSIALGRVAAALAWMALGNDPWDQDGAVHIELVMPMGLDPIASVPEVAFRWALREDLESFLDERWKHLVEQPSLLLLVIGRLPLLFDFGRWRRLFAAYLVPSQILMNSQGGGSLAIYNPALPVGIRSH